MNFAPTLQANILELNTKPKVSVEELLIKRLVSNDRSAQKELYNTYFTKMLGIPIRYTSNREDAYEILNDSFMKVFGSIRNYKPTGSLSGWIAKIVLHTTLDFVRKKYRIKEQGDFNQAQIISVHNEALSNLGIEEIYEKIQHLPDASRAVFSMFVIDGYSHKEIAEKLGISTGTSKWHLSNARVKLQELLKA